MATVFPRERLTRLADLARHPEAPAGKLSSELADLLQEWPDSYPRAMREPFEALLARSLRDLAPQARARLAARFAEAGNMPLTVLNALFFNATAEVRQAILTRNAAAALGSDSIAIDEQTLLKSARSGADSLSETLALHFDIDLETAANVAKDSTGVSLAVLCKAANCSRATFSALAVLASPEASADETYRRLSGYEKVPADAAIGLLRFWQATDRTKLFTIN